MQRLRKRAHVVERGLSDFIHFAQFGAKRRALWRVFLGARQHRADSRQNLPELVVQLARDISQSGFLRRNQLLREFAAVARKGSKLREEAAIRPNQVKAREQNRYQDCGQEQINLPLHLFIDLRHLGAGLLIALVVLNEQPCNGRAQRPPGAPAA